MRITTFEDAELADLSLEEKYPELDPGNIKNQIAIDNESARLRTAVQVRSVVNQFLDLLASLGVEVDNVEYQYSIYRGLFIEVTKGIRYGGIRLDPVVSENTKIPIGQVKAVADALTANQSTPPPTQ